MSSLALAFVVFLAVFSTTFSDESILGYKTFPIPLVVDDDVETLWTKTGQVPSTVMQNVTIVGNWLEICIKADVNGTDCFTGSSRIHIFYNASDSQIVHRCFEVAEWRGPSTTIKISKEIELNKVDIDFVLLTFSIAQGVDEYSMPVNRRRDPVPFMVMEDQNGTRNVLLGVAISEVNECSIIASIRGGYVASENIPDVLPSLYFPDNNINTDEEETIAEARNQAPPKEMEIAVAHFPLWRTVLVPIIVVAVLILLTALYVILSRAMFRREGCFSNIDRPTGSPCSPETVE
ncbi:hypothetical protein QR680_004794 [Steinernema hermaphroditum]|uniref:DOMON domain-containing protein n=1 Tax=Steinernema hermaphroditum TaxID=289476 RepID=A0AA39LTS6_9BILA|nr:hypothetical protein QR680_004794 [Steinernema hermaphroditum]